MVGGNADPLERRWLVQEIDRLKKENERLKKEYERLKKENERLKEENERLKEENKRQKEECAMKFGWVKQENTFLKNQVEDSKTKIRELTEECERRMKQIEELIQQRQDLKEKHRREMKWLFRRNRRGICDYDCVCCIIAMICENNKLGLGVKFCCPQLRTIISLYAGPKFEPKHLQCHEFMDLLRECNIVALHEEYELSTEQIFAWQNMARQAFNELMTMDPNRQVVIIGRVFRQTNAKGHAELCYLNTRTQDKKVTIFDPQTETSREFGLKEFIDHVKDDEKVIFYVVNIRELKRIIDKYFDFLHTTTFD